MNSMQYIRQRELKDPLTHRNRQEISSVNPQNSYNASKKAAANILKRIYSKPHDSIFHELVKLISSLEKAIELTYWDDIEASVGDIIAKVLDTSPIMSGAGEAVSPQAKHTKELFCRLGGFQLLLKLFEPPFTPGDGRKITPALLNEKCEIWNEILLLLRELACALPGMSETVFTDKVVVFFFTLLSQNTIFDNTMNLLEEILVSREESFLLGKIPEFYALVNKFSARQLAHFCRVLSLVIFEPEDRQIMEGAQVLRSTELLQLRKNRMAKSSSAIVEKNQSLVRYYSH